jgi:hypothetical protein
MIAVLIALLGIAGTLGAVVLTARAQRDTASQAEHAATRRQLAEQRIAAFSDFAECLIDYRRAELQTWYEVDDARRSGRALDTDDALAAPAARAARSAAWGSYYRMRLLWSEQALLERAERLLHGASDLRRATSSDQVKAAADQLRIELGTLADHARRNINSAHGEPVA